MRAEDLQAERIEPLNRYGIKATPHNSGARIVRCCLKE